MTGTILFTETAKSGMQSTILTQQDAATGKATYTETRQMVDKKGFAIVPKFIFIDGRTGEQLYTETYNQEVLLQLDPEHAAAVVLFRVDGQAPAGLPADAQHPEDQGHEGPAQVESRK